MIWTFFLTTLAIGSLTFGGGYAMVSALQRELVVRYGWLSPAEFSNAVAVGQVTPGPLMIMVAFMGYRLGGVWGALLGTVGLFLPSFVLVLVLAERFERVRRHPAFVAAMRGVSGAVLGLLAAAVVDLGRTSLGDVPGIFLAAATFVWVGPLRKEAVWPILAAAAAGYLLLR